MGNALQYCREYSINKIVFQPADPYQDFKWLRHACPGALRVMWVNSDCNNDGNTGMQLSASVSPSRESGGMIGMMCCCCRRHTKLPRSPDHYFSASLSERCQNKSERTMAGNSNNNDTDKPGHRISGGMRVTYLLQSISAIMSNETINENFDGTEIKKTTGQNCYCYGDGIQSDDRAHQKTSVKSLGTWETKYPPVTHASTSTLMQPQTQTGARAHVTISPTVDLPVELLFPSKQPQQQQQQQCYGGSRTTVQHCRTTQQNGILIFYLHSNADSIAGGSYGVWQGIQDYVSKKERAYFRRRRAHKPSQGGACCNCNRGCCSNRNSVDSNNCSKNSNSYQDGTTKTHVVFVAPEYPGYCPRSYRESVMPTVASTQNTCLAVFTHVVKQYPNYSVVVVGRSLGATFATWLAAQVPTVVHRLVLVCPFYSLRELAKDLLTQPFRTVNKSAHDDTDGGSDTQQIGNGIGNNAEDDVATNNIRTKITGADTSTNTCDEEQEQEREEEERANNGSPGNAFCEGHSWTTRAPQTCANWVPRTFLSNAHWIRAALRTRDSMSPLSAQSHWKSKSKSSGQSRGKNGSDNSASAQTILTSEEKMTTTTTMTSAKQHAHNSGEQRQYQQQQYQQRQSGKPLKVLFLHGDHDELISSTHSARLHSLCEARGCTAKMSIQRGAGHNTVSEDCADFYKFIFS